MRSIIFSAGLLLLAVPSQAAEIRVLAPGLVGPGLPILAERWSARTGNSVAAGGGTVGKIEQIVAADDTNDLVLLPSSEFSGIATKLKSNSQKTIGRVIFGLAVPAGSPHPDISTAEKFRAALAGKTVAYNDPANGSLAGKMVDALLKQPPYSAAKGMPSKSLAGLAVASGVADMAIAVVAEEVGVKGVDIVGPIPDAVGLRIDISGAVLANAAHPDEAASFLAYITTPEAAAVFKPTGIVSLPEQMIDRRVP
jgi:molybdate transport system substrate-binding protein